MESKKYSERLGTIDDAQFQDALRRLNLGEFIRAEAVTGGLFGQNVFVTSTRGEWVLRGSPHYDWQLPGEQFFAQLLHRHTRAPVPWPYLVDPNDDIFGWSYAIMPRLPGLSLSDDAAVEGLTLADRIEMAHAMAENLTLVHALTWASPGQYDLATNTITPFKETWGDWVTAEIRSWLKLARPHSDRTTDDDVAWIECLLATAHGALGEAFQPCIVLRDYGEHNVVMSRTSGKWQISGMFDLMEASFGDSEMDLSRQTAIYLEKDPDRARTFLRRYMELRPPRPGFEGRFPVYMLRDRIIVWEYFQRPGMTPAWDEKLTFREWAEPYTSSYSVLIGGET